MKTAQRVPTSKNHSNRLWQRIRLLACRRRSSVVRRRFFVGHEKSVDSKLQLGPNLTTADSAVDRCQCSTGNDIASADTINCRLYFITTTVEIADVGRSHSLASIAATPLKRIIVGEFVITVRQSITDVSGGRVRQSTFDVRSHRQGSVNGRVGAAAGGVLKMAGHSHQRRPA